MQRFIVFEMFLTAIQFHTPVDLLQLSQWNVLHPLSTYDFQHQPPFSSPVLSTSDSATCLLLWWRVGTCDVVHRPRICPEEHSRSAVAFQVPLLLDPKAVASQQLSGHHHEGFLHVLTLLDTEKENFRLQIWSAAKRVVRVFYVITFADVSNAASMPPLLAKLQASSNWTWRSSSRSHLLPRRRHQQELIELGVNTTHEYPIGLGVINICWYHCT